MMAGMDRVPLPNVDRLAFREGLVNALAHRDYAVNNAIYIQWRDEGLSISNPGGFIDGVSQENILTAEPHSRNHVLADALKRIGLAERSGRGVDNIFRAVLRVGRPAPTYVESTATVVKLRFPFHAADTEFVKLTFDLRDRLAGEPTLEMLIVLRALRDAGTATVAELHHLAQRPVTDALAALAATGVVAMKGESVRLFTEPRTIDYAQITRQVLAYVDAHGKITRREAMALLDVGEDQAYRLLTKMVKQGVVVRQGGAKDAFYTRTP